MKVNESTTSLCYNWINYNPAGIMLIIVSGEQLKEIHNMIFIFNFYLCSIFLVSSRSVGVVPDTPDYQTVNY